MEFFGRQMTEHPEGYPPGFYSLKVAGFNVCLEPIREADTSEVALWEGSVWIGDDLTLVPQVRGPSAEETCVLLQKAVEAYMERLLVLVNFEEQLVESLSESGSLRGAIREGIEEGLAPLEEFSATLRRIGEVAQKFRARKCP